ncbi:MAG: lipid-A-disaccharide synthase [Bacteroidales bacterium]|nr:lipid-A-disaccharide synthase [Bacteroidales bacterium]
MRYYIIAGEASGDLHASNLMKQLKIKDALADFRCWGGDLMKAQGAFLVKHYKDLAFMGFLEVITNIRTIYNNLKLCEQDLLTYKPDALILVDYPGFNLRMAKFAKSEGIKVFYYISPQVWAWKKSRVHLIKKVVDKMLVILPFEKEFYAQFNYMVEFVGHPLLDAINSDYLRDKVEPAITSEKPIIALLPGSRKQEIEKMLPKMLTVRHKFPEYNFVVCGVKSIDVEIYNKIINKQDVTIVYNNTYNILRSAFAALVTSGTATLETALFKVPQVVCYDANYISYIIAKNLIQLKFISLVNLIMDKKVVTELIQNDLNEENLIAELNLITRDTKNRERVMEDYSILQTKLGGMGASERAAGIIHNNLLP